MRHRKSGRRLNRNSAHRTAMFRNMATSLFEHETIRTTLAKAKALRGFAEPLITLAKEDTVANRRLAFTRLRNDRAVGKLFTDLGQRFASRPGGYLRILKDGYRVGDCSPMAVVQLVKAQTAPQKAVPQPATPDVGVLSPETGSPEPAKEKQSGWLGRLRRRVFTSAEKEEEPGKD